MANRLQDKIAKLNEKQAKESLRSLVKKAYLHLKAGQVNKAMQILEYAEIEYGDQPRLVK